MRDLLSAAAERAIRYLETLDSRSVAPTSRAVSGLARDREPGLIYEGNLVQPALPALWG